MAIDILWGVEGAISDGPPQFAYHIEYAYDGGGAVEYIGWALASPTPGPVAGLPAVTSLVPATGPVTSGAYWAIKKFVYSGTSVVRILWADGNTQQDNVFDDRASLTYL